MSSQNKSTFGDRLNEWKLFLWNSNKNEFLGRGGKSWALITIFYVIFYAFLAALFCITMWVMLQTISEAKPRYQDRVSSPGVMIRPRGFSQSKGIEVTVDPKKNATVMKYMSMVNEFFSRYQKEQHDVKDCKDGEYRKRLKEDAEMPACSFNLSLLGDCADPEREYRNGTPCVYIKMNKIIGFIPGNGTHSPQVSCEGHKGADIGPVSYFPSNKKLDIKYFPYFGSKYDRHYLQPVVAVRFENLPLNQKSAVECRVTGASIKIDENRDKYLGRVIFRLQRID
uniref:Sodium/potassium-transporting ATPase subunit beta n=1 Tax=Eptatretus burgeri TaxID=7764 RepID=A0A8C4X2H4_EPTBU